MSGIDIIYLVIFLKYLSAWVEVQLEPETQMNKSAKTFHCDVIQRDCVIQNQYSF